MANNNIMQEINNRGVFKAESLTVTHLFEAENYLISLNVHNNLSGKAKMYIIRQVKDKRLYIQNDFRNIYKWGEEFLGVGKSLISQYLSASDLLSDGAYSRYASNEGDFNAAQLIEMRPREETKNKKELTVSDIDELIAKGIIHYTTSPKEIRQIINDFLNKNIVEETEGEESEVVWIYVKSYIADKKINEEISIDGETLKIETANNKYIFAVVNDEPICNIYEKGE